MKTDKVCALCDKPIVSEYLIHPVTDKLLCAACMQMAWVTVIGEEDISDLDKYDDYESEVKC